MVLVLAAVGLFIGLAEPVAALADGGGRTTYTEVFGRFRIEAVEYER
jgi:hypothetical protein